MSFADRTVPPPARAGLPCSTGKLLATLDDGEAAALQQILEDPRWQHRAVYQLIRDEGHAVAESAVAHHRRKQCRCFA